MNEKLLAFRNYLKALEVAEQAKKDELIKDASQSLTGFYAGIHEYDKAIDYELKVIDLERKLGTMYEMTSAYNYVAATFSLKKRNMILRSGCSSIRSSWQTVFISR